jgi:integrase
LDCFPYLPLPITIGNDIQSLLIPEILLFARSLAHKTSASERTIPIHPRIIELGFMKYLKGFERKPHSKLFPDIPTGTTGYRSDTFSKNFRRFLRFIEADADRTSFHSFRHNFRDALRECNVRHEIAMLLGGWSDRSRSLATQMFYGRGITMKTILKELRAVNFSI